METTKFLSLGVVAMVAMTVSACGGATNSSAGEPPASTPVPAQPVAASSPAAGLERLRGEAVVGKDGYGVTPCGSDRQRIVEFAPDAQAFIDRFLEPGGRLAFFFDGWVREREGKWIVDSVERVHTEGPRCDAPLEQAMFVARGTEPFWSLSLSATGWELQRPGQEALRVQAPATRAGTAYVWESSAPAAKVEIVPGYCADGMADAASGWEAKLSLDGKTLSGCAHRGALALP
ncbi:hypothetical protein J5837_13905 [Pseudoxanthomonas helianthi]|uniref:Lipoprotein n=1 Tax=Pseudoxanthomonas helianthi TaxID=1453541 RepID=A0A941AWD0_9GAMM|nr:hypothetical protein [Pseudoxanthomonas helianthi]MBP3985502.1 hypothetical protein [Pseudoxanthomonas helianthi]